ncbi:small-conductance mechanosensitive channel [Stackebrandtia endophytica]|uniref:Small-conductance mechanosensitive channel n=1 Tax=Stackebrandtia endophytica TaxID=1496996 RepID=A0A543AZ79_9ACTN|nr:mechanosensitive ion channel domain-containing protein [Stackebrandtia endophytica]TQL77883.1 small-conductance mechanosensitive channel [Stackebrandtia endophytica]
MGIDVTPVWVVLGVSIGGAFLISLARMVLSRVWSRRNRVTTLMKLIYRPTQLFTALLVARLSLLFVDVTELHIDTGHWVTLGLLANGAWLITRLLRSVRMSAERGADDDEPEDIEMRRRRTQSVIVYRVGSGITWIVAFAAGMLTFPEARSFGTGLLASAGVVGAIMGLAAQSLLKDAFAGVRLAFGDALRLGDIVVVEGEWGKVEKIALTYVVIRIWDKRCLILPSSFFATTPFSNWTIGSMNLTTVVLFDVDWSFPVKEARRELARITAASPHWDGKAQHLQVTDAVGPYLRIRATASAPNADSWWSLQCEIREGLTGWVARHHPECVPTMRLSRDPVPPGPPPEDATMAETIVQPTPLKPLPRADDGPAVTVTRQPDRRRAPDAVWTDPEGGG